MTAAVSTRGPTIWRIRRQLAATAPRSISRIASGAETFTLEGFIGQLVAAYVVVEFGGVAVEAQRDLADRPVALLRHHDLGCAVDFLAARLVLFHPVVEFVLGFLGP